jgi:hypothetical protein
MRKESVNKNLYYNILILSVRPAIDSAPGHHTDLRPVSLEPVWPEEVRRKKFSRKVTSGQNNEQIVTRLMLFYRKILSYIIAVLFWTGHCLYRNITSIISRFSVSEKLIQLKIICFKINPKLHLLINNMHKAFPFYLRKKLEKII